MKRKKRISRFTNVKVVLWGLLAIWWGMGICGDIMVESVEAGDLATMVIIEVLLIWRFMVNLKIYRSDEYKQLQQRVKAAQAEYRASAPERERIAREARAEMEKAERLDNTPVSAMLISTQDRTKTSKSAVSAAGRAMIGGALLGPVGALAGAASTGGKTKVVGQKATFSVKYASGRVGTETVEVGSTRFNELAALLLEDK